jgi:hypothetical protein
VAIRNIRLVYYRHLNNKVQDEWKSLAFGRGGTYNPANREKRSRRLCVPSEAPLFPGTCQEARIPKQDRDEARSGWNAVAAKLEKNTFPKKAIFQRSKEPY